jgi:hypothetical protein
MAQQYIRSAQHRNNGMIPSAPQVVVVVETLTLRCLPLVRGMETGASLGLNVSCVGIHDVEQVQCFRVCCEQSDYLQIESVQDGVI